MDHHIHHHAAPLHWGYSTPTHHNTWIPPPTGGVPTTPTTPVSSTITSGGMITRAAKRQRVMSESDCDDVFSEGESSKDHTSPGESDSCQLMSRKKRRGVIEKKRRDRINSSLSELKRLVPSAYEKQGSAKLEKAEILQLTVDHLKTLHAKGVDPMSHDSQRFALDYHIIGLRECATEVARYLVTIEGMDIQDPLRLRLMSHLQCFVAQREVSVKSGASHTNWSTTPPNPHTTTTSAGYQPQYAAAYPTQPAYPSSPPSSANSYLTSPIPATAHHHLHQQSHHQQQQQQQQQASSAASRTSVSQNSPHLDEQHNAQSGSDHHSHQQQQDHYNVDLQQQQQQQQHDHHPEGLTYIDLTDANVGRSVSVSTASSAVNSSAVASVAQYGNPYYPLSQGYATAAGVAYNPNGSKPYRPWGAEMAY